LQKSDNRRLRLHRSRAKSFFSLPTCNPLATPGPLRRSRSMFFGLFLGRIGWIPHSWEQSGRPLASFFALVRPLFVSPGLLAALPGPRAYPGSCREHFGAFRSIFLIWGGQEVGPALFREIRLPGPSWSPALPPPPPSSPCLSGVDVPGRCHRP
jgi:hypothetical protein